MAVQKLFKNWLRFAKVIDRYLLPRFMAHSARMSTLHRRYQLMSGCLQHCKMSLSCSHHKFRRGLILFENRIIYTTHTDTVTHGRWHIHTNSQVGRHAERRRQFVQWMSSAIEEAATATETPAAIRHAGYTTAERINYLQALKQL